MCQLMTNPSLKIAKHDIVCYKLLKQWESGAYVTYYQNYLVKLGKMYEEDLSKFDEIVIPSKYLSPYSHVIEGGGFHLFTDDFELFNNLWYFSSDNLIMAECTVPAGTLYYEGEFKILTGYVGRTIVSQKMRIDHVYDKFEFCEKVKKRHKVL